jgi:predicted anti-sigma-YlaC factor YlaD
MHRVPRRIVTMLLLVGLAGPAFTGCAVRKMAMRSVANSLAKSGDTFASDDDPELIRAAVPFSLKLVESLLTELPEHRGLLLTACAGFTQYAYAFVEGDGEILRDADYGRFLVMQDRARRMYLRGRDYCLRSLELQYSGITAELSTEPRQAVSRATSRDVALLYWTTAAWGKAVAISLDRPALIADLPAVQALARRALELDESFNEGALHEVMLALEALPEAMGGSPARARHHFERAVALSHGTSAGPYVSFARSVALPRQDREAFVELLTDALRVDVNRVPRLRLANILAQQQARMLLDQVNDLFLDDGTGGDRPEEGSARARDQEMHR